MANVKIRAFVQKFGTHGASIVIRELRTRIGTPDHNPDTEAFVQEMARELEDALEEVLHEDPESGH